jgi:DNA helicase-2/ATP-dependent DNA helicase PcrA
MADIKTNKTSEGISRAENIEELLNGIKEYSKIAENKENRTMIAEYLQNVSLITDMDKNSSKGNNQVTLMTVHAAKGLEFNYVYIVGMEEGLFPGTNSINSESALEEERRLFYVALTRAAIKVTISFAQTRYRWGNASASMPSRFLRDIDYAYLTANSIRDSINASNYSPSNFSYNNFMNNIPADHKLKSAKQKQRYQPAGAANTSNTSNISALKAGTEVEHARFGYGRVVEIGIEGNEARAKVEFYTSGLRTLLLKYAQLNIVKEPL